jgi:hypothetical protein
MAIVSLAFHLWGIRRDLPYVTEPDEGAVVRPAAHIAASGDWHPDNFLYPASTVIYPLAVVYRLRNGFAHGGPWLRADAEIARRLEDDPSEFYLLARLLSVAYAVATLPVTYALGRIAFGTTVGLLAAWFVVLSPLAVGHAQIARTDSAGMFFTALTLWLCCRLYDRPTVGRSILAGAAMGFGAASRYFLVALLPVLLIVDVAVLWARRARPRDLAAGLLAFPLAFIVAAPYLVLDLPGVRRDLQVQASPTHLGADGLSFAGNLRYYAAVAAPAMMTAAPALLAGAGTALAIGRREPKPLLLVLATASWLVGVCLSSLHWARWLIPLLPVLAVQAAAAVMYVARGIRSRRLRLVALSVALAALSATPLSILVRSSRSLARPSTRVAAREWMLAHLPGGAKVAQEWYTAALAGTGFVLREPMSLARGKTVDDYRKNGFRYLVTSDSIEWRYLEAPARYPAETAFYRELAREGHVLQEFTPSATRSGPHITVYELPVRPTGAAPDRTPP